MGTSHADGFLRLHQIAEHFRTMHHWDALFHGSLIFHVGFADRRGTHDDVDVIGDVFRLLSIENCSSLSGELLSDPTR